MSSKLKDFLKKIGKPLGGVLDLAGDISGIEFIEKAGEAIKYSTELSPEEKQEALKLLAIDAQDRADSRAMQVAIATSSNSSWLSKNFLYILASFWSLVATIYFFLATFTTVVNQSNSSTILGFLLGTAVSAIISFFFGSSEGSKTKDQVINKKGLF